MAPQVYLLVIPPQPQKQQEELPAVQVQEEHVQPESRSAELAPKEETKKAAVNAESAPAVSELEAEVDELLRSLPPNKSPPPAVAPVPAASPSPSPVPAASGKRIAEAESDGVPVPEKRVRSSPPPTSPAAATAHAAGSAPTALPAPDASAEMVFDATSGLYYERSTGLYYDQAYDLSLSLSLSCSAHI
jgi:cytoskeletal protein RodZ